MVDGWCYNNRGEKSKSKRLNSTQQYAKAKGTEEESEGFSIIIMILQW